MHKVAVLIPTYKPAWYLGRCLTSLDRQTLGEQGFKVYIALNGPREPYEGLVLSILKRLSFAYEYVYLEQAGVSRARNALLDKVSEPYVVFVDDDDVVSDNYLEGLLAVSTFEDMGISCVVDFDTDVTHTKSNFIGETFEKLSDVETSKLRSRKYFSSPWAKMLHKDIIGDTRFDVRLAIGEDSLFMAQLSSNVRSIKKVTNNACYYVYEREGSATRKKAHRAQELNRIFYLLRAYFKMLVSNKYNKPFVMTRIAATFKHCKKLL